MADDNCFAAAQLAAALIQAGKLTEKARGNTVEDATRLYFDCLDAFRAESKKRYPLDAPKQLIDERRRLDALSDLQRYKGCTVMEPGPAVVEERLKLEGSVRPPPPPLPPPVVLNSKG